MAQEALPTFKYVADASSCSVPLDDETPCDLCGRVVDPRWGSFVGEPSLDAVCAWCVAKGIPDGAAQRRDGDQGTLRAQLQEKQPQASAKAIQRDVDAKLDELARRTPPVLSWQDWDWPACCGDFTRFLRHAGQREIDALARDRGGGSGEALFRASLVDADQYDPELWHHLPSEPVTVNSNWKVQAYVFECLTCRRLLVQWDCI